MREGGFTARIGPKGRDHHGERNPAAPAPAKNRGSNSSLVLAAWASSSSASSPSASWASAAYNNLIKLDQAVKSPGPRSKTSISAGPTSSPTWSRRSRARPTSRRTRSRPSPRPGPRSARPRSTPARSTIRPRSPSSSRPRTACRRALSRLMVVVEKYPELKATENFQDAAIPARRHRKPDHGRAPALQRGRPGLQHQADELPDGPHRRILRLPVRREALLQGGRGLGRRLPRSISSNRPTGHSLRRFVSRPSRAAAVLLIAAAVRAAAEIVIPPSPDQWVTDAAGFLSPACAERINAGSGRIRGAERASDPRLHRQDDRRLSHRGIRGQGLRRPGKSGGRAWMTG